MKVVHLSTSDMGGAGIAARQLHLALVQKGIDSVFISKVKLSGETPFQIVTGSKGDEAELRNYYLKNKVKGYDHFSFPFSELDIHELEAIKNADVIHLHWISDYFVDYKKIFSLTGKKFVWTLHDANPFTGGCHVTDGCPKFTFNCNYCPQLAGTIDEYLSNKLLKYKLDALSNIKTGQLKVVTPSKWLSGLSQQSKALGRFGHSVIPNIINFPDHVIEKEQSRRELGIDKEDTVFLFVAHSSDSIRKGSDVLRNAMQKVKDKKKVKLITIGQISGNYYEGINVIELGFVTDKTILQKAYTAADAFLLPSMSENFPNTIIESLLCGTPVIASNVGGIPEQIDATNGILVESGNMEAWSNEINAFAKDKYNRVQISSQARTAYNNDKITEEYLKLYTSF